MPRQQDIPVQLTHLTFQDVITLRPLSLHNGDYLRESNGHRKKNGYTRVSWTNESPAQKIQNLEDEDAKRHCQIAYEYLMNCESSSYRKFVCMS